MTMEQLMRWLATAATLFVAVPVLAAQDDPRLAALFERLGRDRRCARGGAVRDADLVDLAPVGRSAHRRADGAGARRIDGSALDRAERFFTEMVEKKPEFAEGWNKRATVRYLARNFEGSIADIDKTLALEPRHFGALSGLGLVYLAMGNEAKALAAFKRALAVHPHLPGTADKIEELEERLGGRRI